MENIRFNGGALVVIISTLLLISCNSGQISGANSVAVTNNFIHRDGKNTVLLKSPKLKNASPPNDYLPTNSLIGFSSLPTYGRPLTSEQTATVTNIIPISTFFIPMQDIGWDKWSASANQNDQDDSSSYDSTAVSAVNGNVYTAFINTLNDNTLSLVTGSATTGNGPNHIWNNLSSNKISHLNMAYSKGNLYIAYKGGSGHAQVQEYQIGSDQTPAYLGSNGQDISSPDSIRDLAISVNGGIPVIAYIANTESGSQELRVKSYLHVAGSNQRNVWLPVHPSSLAQQFQQQILRQSVKAISVAVSRNGSIYVAFNDDSSYPGTSSLNVLECKDCLNPGNSGSWSFIGGGYGSNQLNPTTGSNPPPPIINPGGGAYETKLAIDDNDNLILAYVTRNDSWLRVQKYTQPTGGNQYGTWSYVGSINPLINQNLNPFGHLTGKNIAHALAISLTLAPHQVFNPSNLNQEENYLYHSDEYCQNCGQSQMTYSNQAILISFSRRDNNDNSAAILAYDGNAWEYIGPTGSSNYDQVAATSISVDKTNGYIALAYIDELDKMVHTSYSPQNPYNKIIFETNTSVEGNFAYNSNNYGFNQPGAARYCTQDVNNPFGAGNTSITSALSAQDPYYIGNEWSYLIDGVDSSGNLLPGPTTIGFNYYNLNNQFLTTETNHYLNNQYWFAKGNILNMSRYSYLNNPINVTGANYNVWTGANYIGRNNYLTCYNWTSNIEDRCSIGNSSEYNSNQIIDSESYLPPGYSHIISRLNWWGITYSEADFLRRGYSHDGSTSAGLYCLEQ